MTLVLHRNGLATECSLDLDTTELLRRVIKLPSVQNNVVRQRDQTTTRTIVSDKN